MHSSIIIEAGLASLLGFLELDNQSPLAVNNSAFMDKSDRCGFPRIKSPIKGLDFHECCGAQSAWWQFLGHQTGLRLRPLAARAARRPILRSMSIAVITVPRPSRSLLYPSRRVPPSRSPRATFHLMPTVGRVHYTSAWKRPKPYPVFLPAHVLGPPGFLKEI